MHLSPRTITTKTGNPQDIFDLVARPDYSNSPDQGDNLLVSPS